MGSVSVIDLCGSSSDEEVAAPAKRARTDEGDTLASEMLVDAPERALREAAGEEGEDEEVVILGEAGEVRVVAGQGGRRLVHLPRLALMLALCAPWFSGSAGGLPSPAPRVRQQRVRNDAAQALLRLGAQRSAAQGRAKFPAGFLVVRR